MIEDSARLEMQLPPNVSPLVRLNTFFGHYDARLYLRDNLYVDVGRGSLSLALKIVVADGNQVTGSAGSIGRFCEAGEEAAVLFGGEHPNDQPVNLVFGECGPLRIAARQSGGGFFVKQPRPVAIGNGVLLSMRALVLDGVAVGDGAVIGAASLVNRDIPSFAIAAGSPAKVLKARLPDEEARAVAAARWWDWSAAYLMTHAARLNALAKQPEGHIYAPDRPRFVFRRLETAGPRSLGLVGFTDGAGVRPIGEAPPQVQAYVQMSQSPAGPFYWVADIWA